MACQEARLVVTYPNFSNNLNSIRNLFHPEGSVCPGSHLLISIVLATLFVGGSTAIILPPQVFTAAVLFCPLVSKASFPSVVSYFPVQKGFADRYGPLAGHGVSLVIEGLYINIKIYIKNKKGAEVIKWKAFI